MGKEYEFQFFDSEPTFESKPTLDPKLNLSHIPELVLVPEPFILEPKSTIPQSHILLLDQGINHNDSEMISKIGHIKGIIFMIGSCMILFNLGIINMYIGKRSSKVGSLKIYVT